MTEEPILIPPGEGELIGDSPDRRVEILSEHESLHATWSRFGPGRDGADLHVHRRHTDLFYVLAGELTIRLGREGNEVAVPAGDLVRVPPLVVHGFRNASEADVRYLNLHAPGRGFVAFMRGLRDGEPVAYDQEPPPAEGTRPPTDAVVGERRPITEGEGPRVDLLADVPEIAISEVSGEPGDPSPRRHERQVDWLYVLNGEIELGFDDRKLRAPAGFWLQVPPEIPYRVSFPGGPARYLNLRTPERAD